MDSRVTAVIEHVDRPSGFAFAIDPFGLHFYVKLRELDNKHLIDVGATVEFEADNSPQGLRAVAPVRLAETPLTVTVKSYVKKLARPEGSSSWTFGFLAGTVETDGQTIFFPRSR